MINFRRGELRKLKKQSKKLGLVTESQIISSNFLGLINTVQNAGWEKDNLGDSAEVDKTTNTMMQLHKLYKVTDTANADEVITAWNRSVEGLASLRVDRDNKERILEEHEADMLALQEDLELLHLTGKGIFMEKNQEMRHVELQEQLDEETAEVGRSSFSETLSPWWTCTQVLTSLSLSLTHDCSWRRRARPTSGCRWSSGSSIRAS